MSDSRLTPGSECVSRPDPTGLRTARSPLEDISRPSGWPWVPLVGPNRPLSPWKNTKAPLRPHVAARRPLSPWKNTKAPLRPPPVPSTRLKSVRTHMWVRKVNIPQSGQSLAARRPLSPRKNTESTPSATFGSLDALHQPPNGPQGQLGWTWGPDRRAGVLGLLLRAEHLYRLPQCDPEDVRAVRKGHCGP
jgi:hypothetical protein